MLFVGGEDSGSYTITAICVVAVVALMVLIGVVFMKKKEKLCFGKFCIWK